MPSYNAEVIAHSGIRNGHPRELVPQAENGDRASLRICVRIPRLEHGVYWHRRIGPPNLKQQIKTAVVSAISGFGIAVATDHDGPWPEGFNCIDSKTL